VDVAAEAGADLLGFVLVRESPRAAGAVLDVPEEMLSVAVWVGRAGEAGADLDQVHTIEEGKVRGREAALLRSGQQVARVLDLPWQGADPGHWEHAAEAEGRIVLAGGLGPENVRDAIAAVRPWAVDAASSLESSPGIKDHDRVRAYVEAART
jgi:phosphoribosylanthranilate isomerase